MVQNLLTAENIAKTYGEKTLFENLTLGIAAGQKIALISRNGMGKTSLLNILTGIEDPDAGLVSMRSGIRVAYLPQEPNLPDQASILDAIFHSANEFTLAVRDYEAAAEHLRRRDNEANQARLQEAMARMDQLEAWDYEARVKEILSRFQIHDLEQSCGTLSGGQRKKVALARTLLEPADILILDEPTNHLDITMIEWLEEYLARERLSLLVVTHDRYFLDNVCNEIIELDNGRLHWYKGGYAYYLEKSAERHLIENKEIEKARNLMRSELEWIRRSPPARTTKSKARVDAFDELKDTASRRTFEKSSTFQVKNDRIGGKVLEIHNIHKSYGPRELIRDFTYIFKKGEKVGIAGANGTGKTTLLNLIAGGERPDRGSITTGQTVKFGYFTQNGISPEGDKRVIDLVKEIAEEVLLDKGSMSASQFLLHFGFTSQLQYSYYSSLSGGEKRKLHLLMTLMSGPNFLILDEPTNDLDIHTLNLLEDFLRSFQGCLVIVSHDRYFMDRLADHIFIFEGEGRIRDFYGNYTEYHLERKKAQTLRKPSASENRQPVNREKPQGPRKPSWKEQREYEALTEEIHALEQERASLLTRLNSGGVDPALLVTWSERVGEIMNELETNEMRWIELSELIDPS
ncbi:MAG TPA: ABC-F family ATP-binding cassette domain-containing protein [Bacteroidales bacterium]|nr:ABC-F family ATP-binding cassette domain-containing protein [Bacteroidales bacterium]